MTDASTGVGPSTDTTGGTQSGTSSETDGSATDGGTQGAMGCGWGDVRGRGMGYFCGFEPEPDPEGGFPFECDEGVLAEGEACSGVPNQGCCDANGDAWRCVIDEITMTKVLVRDICV